MYAKVVSTDWILEIISNQRGYDSKARVNCETLSSKPMVASFAHDLYLRYLAHIDKPLDANGPLPQLRRRHRTLQLSELGQSSIPIPRSNSLANLHNPLDRHLAQDIFVVQVIEQNTQTLLHVINLRLELRWCYRFDAADIGGQDIHYWLRGR